MSVETNIAATKIAKDVWALVSEEALKLDPESQQHLYEKLHVYILDCLPEKKSRKDPDEPMSNEEASRFGKSKMPFGKHVDKTIDETPMDYLEWLDAQPDFRRQLRRYLESERIQNEPEEPAPWEDESTEVSEDDGDYGVLFRRPEHL